MGTKGERGVGLAAVAANKTTHLEHGVQLEARGLLEARGARARAGGATAHQRIHGR